MALVTTDRNLITVSGDVQLGSGSADFTDTVFLTTGSGDSLRFIEDNAATYTRCTFYEGENSLAYGAENFRHTTQDPVDGSTSGERSRFNTAYLTTSTPVFRGCTFTVQNSARSDFDISNTPAMPEVTFEYDDFGTPCRIVIDSTTGQQINFASEYLHIDGLIVDNQSSISGLCMAFVNMNADPDYIKNLEVVDPSPGSLDAHVGFLMTGMMSVGDYRQIRGLKARNVALQGADSSANVRTLKLIDPIGRIEKATGSSWDYYGQLEVYRTIGTSLYDAITIASLTGRIIHFDSTNAVIGDSIDTASFEKVLHQFTQPVNSLTVNTDNSYSEKLLVYGYDAQSRSFTVGDEQTVDALISVATYFFADPYISETDRALVKAYTTIADADELYDGLASLEYERTDDISIAGDKIATVSGTHLDFGSKDVHISDTLPKAIQHFPPTYTTTEPEFSTYNSYEAGSRAVEWEGLTYSDFVNGNSWTDFRFNQILWKPDGTLFIVSGQEYGVDDSKVLMRFSCSTPWDMSTAVQDEWKKWNMWGTVGNVSISPDGTKVLWGNEGTRWYYATLTTAWSLTGAAPWLPGFSFFTFPNSDEGAHTWNDDGTELTTCSHARTDGLLEVKTYTCSTAYDGSTATYSSSFTISSDIAVDSPEGFSGGAEPNRKDNYGGIRWVDSGAYLLVLDGRNGNILLFEAGTAYDVTTIDTYGNADVFINGPSWEEVSTTFAGIEVANGNIYYGSVKPIAASGTAYQIATYPLTAVTNMYGVADKVYIKSNTLAVGTHIDTIETTGYVTVDPSSTTGLQIIDAVGVISTITISSIVPGSRIHITNNRTGGAVADAVVASTSYNHQFYYGTGVNDIQDGDVLNVRLIMCDGTQLYDWWDSDLIATGTQVNVLASQQLDTYYPQLGVDGSTVTEYALDGANIQVDIDDPDGVSQKRRLIAWFYYAVAQDASAMQTFWRGVDLLSTAEARVNIDLFIDNAGARQVHLNDDDFWLYRSDGVSWVQYPSTGGYGIHTDSGKIYVAETGVSGLTPAESAQLSGLDTSNLDVPVSSIDQSATLTAIETDLETINTGIQKASKLVPHSEDL